jgi:TetR/AcrR family transcriptional repressor of nem operon
MPRAPSFDRDDLIERAMALFWRKGWAGTSLKDLEAALNLRPGSIYAAFGSKEALYGLALDRYAKSGAARLDRLCRDKGPLEALKANVFAVTVEGPDPRRACMLAKTLLELAPQDSALARQASNHLTRAEEGFFALFRAAQDAGQIAADHDPAALARRYQSDIMGLRVSVERPDIDALALVRQVADQVSALSVSQQVKPQE